MRLNFTTGPMELEREDGWFYRLHGVLSIDMESTYDSVIYTVRVMDVSDRTLDSIRTLRDELEPYGMTLAISTDNY